MEKLLEMAKKAADQAEVYSLEETADTVRYENAALKDIESKTQSGISLRVIKEGKLVIEGTPKQIITHAKTENLEEAYLKIMGAKKTDELLAWRETGREQKLDKEN